MDTNHGNIKLWARLGVSIEVTPAELSALQHKDIDAATQTLLTLIKSDRCRVNGETYFPIDIDGNKQLSEKEDLVFQIDPTPLHSPHSQDFAVETPHGTLHIYDKQDPDYPGVWIDLKQPGDLDVTLAMVEYIPGGEGISDYIPSQPTEMWRQQEEVPEVRRSDDSVTAGFVTRSWPDEIHNNEMHKRTFHSGYTIPREQSLESKLLDAQLRTEHDANRNSQDSLLYK